MISHATVPTRRTFEVSFQKVNCQWRVEEISKVPDRHFENHVYLINWGWQIYLHRDSHVEALESGMAKIESEIAATKRVDSFKNNYAVVRLVYRKEPNGFNCVYDVGVDYIAETKIEAMTYIQRQKSESRYWLCPIPTTEKQSKSMGDGIAPSAFQGRSYGPCHHSD